MKPGETILSVQSITTVSGSADMSFAMRSITLPRIRRSQIDGLTTPSAEWIRSVPFLRRILLMGDIFEGWLVGIDI